MFDMDLHSTVRGVSMVLCAVVLTLAFLAIVYTHWAHRRRAQTHFHTTTLQEMGWSITPMLMVLALVAAAFKDFWLV